MGIRSLVAEVMLDVKVQEIGTMRFKARPSAAVGLESCEFCGSAVPRVRIIRELRGPWPFLLL